jgi:phage shock protein E
MKRFLFLVAISMSLLACSQNKGEMGTDVSVAEAKVLISEQSDLVILDVRTPQEVEQGKIDQSIHLNIFDPGFEAELDKLDKSKTYLVYCKSGGRSAKAVALMESKEFVAVHNLKGGITAWNTSKK